MKFHWYKKEFDGTHYYLNDSEIFEVLEECTDDFEKWYNFLSKYIEMSNWYNSHTSPMNGDTAYATLCGWVTGYMNAMKLEEVVDRDEDTVTLYRGKKRVVKFDRIPLSDAEKLARAENRDAWNALLGD